MKSLRSILTGFLSDDLIRHTSILFSGMMVVHVCNLFFQMTVIRRLPGEEYALLAAFLGILAIITRPLSTLTTGVSHYSSLLYQNNRSGDVKRLCRKWVMLTSFPGLFFCLIVVTYRSSLAGMLHLDREAPVLVVGLLLPVLFCSPVFTGSVQGLQLFAWSSASIISGALVRLCLGAGFVLFLYPACGWAMLGHGLGLCTGSAVLFVGLFLMLRKENRSKEPLPSLRFYLLQNFFVQAAYAILMTADVVLVKHYLPDDTEFAVAATIGRMVVFLPGAIVVAMFPKVSSSGDLTRKQKSVFLRSLWFTVLFVLVAALGCVLFSGLLARLFGKEPSGYLKQMIGLMAFVMGGSAILNLIVQFLIAQRRFKPAFLTILFAGLYLISVAFFHSSARVIAIWAGVWNLLALVTLVIYVVKRLDDRLEQEEVSCESE